MRHSSRLFLIAVTVGSVGCGNSINDVGQGDDALRNGSPVSCGDLTDGAKAGIAHLWTDTIGNCTATLVRPNVIITGAHCFVEPAGRAYWDSSAPWRTYPRTAHSSTFTLHPTSPTSAECGLTPQSFRVVRWVTFGSGTEDLAIAELGSSVTAANPNIQTFSIATTKPQNAAGITVYGRGCNNSVNDPGVDADHVLRYKDLTWYGTSTGWSCGIGEYCGWNNNGTSYQVYGSAVLNYPDGLSHLCPGDSGGPGVAGGTSIFLVNQSVYQSYTSDVPKKPFSIDYYADVIHVGAIATAMGFAAGLNGLADMMSTDGADAVAKFATAYNSVPAGGGSSGNTVSGGSGCCAAGINNFCSLPPNTTGCEMTAPGGYCDPNGDGGYTDGDWTKGYYDYQATCTSTPTNSGGSTGSSICPCKAGIDNFCAYPPNTSGCSMTAPGGYCDPNGDGSYTDGDWVKGYYDYAAACPK